MLGRGSERRRRLGIGALVDVVGESATLTASDDPAAIASTISHDSAAQQRNDCRALIRSSSFARTFRSRNSRRARERVSGALRDQRAPRFVPLESRARQTLCAPRGKQRAKGPWLDGRRQTRGGQLVVPRHHSKDLVRRHALGIPTRRRGRGVVAIVPQGPVSAKGAPSNTRSGTTQWCVDCENGIYGFL